jgi:hypothetical protein
VTKETIISGLDKEGIALGPYRLLFVKALIGEDAETIILFENGREARLPISSANYNDSYKLAHDSLDSNRPIGATISQSNIVLDIRSAEQDTIVKLGPEDVKEGLEARFQTHAAIYKVDKSQLNYNRLKDILSTSAKDKTPVWFIASPGSAIQDALPVVEKK